MDMMGSICIICDYMILEDDMMGSTDQVPEGVHQRDAGPLVSWKPKGQSKIA